MINKGYVQKKKKKSHGRCRRSNFQVLQILRKRKSNLLMPFSKIVNQMGSFGHIRKNLFFRFCQPILDIFGFTLLRQ